MNMAKDQVGKLEDKAEDISKNVQWKDKDRTPERNIKQWRKDTEDQQLSNGSFRQTAIKRQQK